MKQLDTSDQNIAMLLKHLVALELWRGGLTQEQIRKRLGISPNTVNAMLKGVSRTVLTRVVTED